MTQVIFWAWQIAWAPSFKECKEKQAQNVSLPHFYKQKLLYEEISKRKWVPIQELALGFLDTNTNVDSIIYGTGDTQHLDEFLNIIHGWDL